jgi:hypothetical protein
VRRDLEKEARAAERGLWSEPKPVAPWEWRKDAADARKLQGTRRVAGSFCVRPAAWTKSGEKPLARIQEWMRDIPKDRLLSEELMQERREEAEMADRE